MKNKTFTLLFISILFFSSCSKYGFVKLNYPLSPQISLPNNIKTIAVVNRSLTKKDNKNNIIESIATAEIAGSDKIASDECLKGVFDQVNGQSNLTIVIPPKTRLYGTGTRETPELLDWKLVKAICDSTKADALLVLETFDSNSDLLVSAVTNQVANVLSGNMPKPNLPNQIRMNILCYWRMYNPTTKTINDQYQNTSYINFEGIGINALPPADALPNTAYAAGQKYIQRFLPSFYTVSRELYKRGKGSSKQDFKAAFRCCEVANWEGAIEIWNNIYKNSSIKNTGRACLNIAVAYEVLGNTEVALEWAKKSYEDYNNKLARDYSNILITRKNIK